MIAKSTDYQITELGVLPTEWKVSKLYDEIENVLDFRGRTPKKLGMDWGNGNIAALSANNVRMGYIDFNAECYLASEELYEKWMTKGDLKKGDVLMTMEAPLGKVAQVPDNNKYILSQRVIAFKSKATLLNVYLKYYLMSDLFQSMLEKNATGTTAKGINQKNLSKLEIIVPTLNEQQKIAEILSAADEQIEKTEQLIEKNKELKKALMQQLFTTGIGHSEFKDTIMGEIPESWKLANLEDISKFITKGSTPTTYGFEWQDQGIFFFKSDVVKNGKFVYGDFKYIDENAHQHMLRSQIQAGDILMTITGNIGRVALVPEGIKRANINQHVARISVENPEVNPFFVFYWLSQSKFIEYYNSIKTGLAYPQISLKQVRETIVPVPSMEEQKKIAEILTSVDEQIDTYEKEKEKQIELKKALMQQLLTGKLRVAV